jgi:hypothetical protein
VLVPQEPVAARGQGQGQGGLARALRPHQHGARPVHRDGGGVEEDRVPPQAHQPLEEEQRHRLPPPRYQREEAVLAAQREHRVALPAEGQAGPGGRALHPLEGEVLEAQTDHQLGGALHLGPGGAELEVPEAAGAPAGADAGLEAGVDGDVRGLARAAHDGGELVDQAGIVAVDVEQDVGELEARLAARRGRSPLPFEDDAVEAGTHRRKVYCWWCASSRTWSTRWPWTA